jgi:glutathione S-transferase
MRVPVLILDGETITEAPAIMTAISQLAPHLHIMGNSNLDVVRVYEWLNWLSGTLHGQAFGGLLRPQRFSDDEGVFGGIKEKGRKTVEECFEKIEGDLRGLHADGDSFTAVDAFLFVFWRWGCGMGMQMGEKYPRYGALVGELVKRDAVKRALEAEGVKSFVAVL